jgi:hypothetical protein
MPGTDHDVLNREGLIAGAGDGPIEFDGAEFIQFLQSLLSVLSKGLQTVNPGLRTHRVLSSHTG